MILIIKNHPLAPEAPDLGAVGAGCALCAGRGGSAAGWGLDGEMDWFIISLWETYGKPMGNLWETYGFTMDFGCFAVFLTMVDDTFLGC